MGTKWVCAGACVMFVLLVALPLRAQETTASFRGTIFDPSGARVPSAKVSAI